MHLVRSVFIISALGLYLQVSCVLIVRSVCAAYALATCHALLQLCLATNVINNGVRAVCFMAVVIFVGCSNPLRMFSTCMLPAWGWRDRKLDGNKGVITEGEHKIGIAGAGRGSGERKVKPAAMHSHPNSFNITVKGGGLKVVHFHVDLLSSRVDDLFMFINAEISKQSMSCPCMHPRKCVNTAFGVSANLRLQAFEQYSLYLDGKPISKTRSAVPLCELNVTPNSVVEIRSREDSLLGGGPKRGQGRVAEGEPDARGFIKVRQGEWQCIHCDGLFRNTGPSQKRYHNCHGQGLPKAAGSPGAHLGVRAGGAYVTILSLCKLHVLQTLLQTLSLTLAYCSCVARCSHTSD